MRRSIPSLSALQAFESAGRLSSFSSAAIELCVTQGAVSRQIRLLEDDLLVKLFVRMTRRVELTDAGRAYLREIQFALDHIERATIKLQGQQQHTVLTIGVLPSVASFWLMPRLASFSKAHPNIETRIVTSIRAADLQSGGTDVAIRVGALPGTHHDRNQPRIELEMLTDWHGVRADFLFPDILVPVCSPLLTDKLDAIKAPSDLLKFPLIHTSTRAHAWSDWLKAEGQDPTHAVKAIDYGHFFMAIEAARAGEGIAIVPKILLSSQSLAGLVIPPMPRIQSAGEYYLLVLEDRSDDPSIATFRQWILDEARPYQTDEASQAGL
jgi:LysR family glycine cleavage system transcriptional activator